MSTHRTVPPAYLAYRILVIVVVFALLAVVGLAVAGDFTALWQGVLSWVKGVRQSWTDLDWQAV